jgi:hypothetical protein
MIAFLVDEFWDVLGDLWGESPTFSIHCMEAVELVWEAIEYLLMEVE